MINFQEFLGVTHRKQISINRNGEFELPKGEHFIFYLVQTCALEQKLFYLEIDTSVD
jgi:hypothetical protein